MRPCFAAPVGRCTTADPITPGGVRPFVKVCELDELRRHGDRVHVLLGDRHVSLIFHRGEVYCLDSLCYHAGGPLGIGDIEDVGGRACLSCPWHLYKVTLESGEKLYGSTRLDEATGKLVPDGVKSAGVRQRTHEVEKRADGWYVRLKLDGPNVESDKYACNDVPGSPRVGKFATGARRDRSSESEFATSSPAKDSDAAASESRVARSLER